MRAPNRTETATAAELQRAVRLATFCAARDISLRLGWSLVAEGKLRVGHIGRRVVVYAEDAAAFDAAARSAGD